MSVHETDAANMKRKEDEAFKLMFEQDMNPRDAFDAVKLNYANGGLDYRRICRRVYRARSKKKKEAELREKKRNKKNYESVQQYRHETNRTLNKLESAYAEINSLKKESAGLQAVADKAKER